MSREEQLKKSLIHWFGGFKNDVTLSNPTRMIDLCRDIMWKEFWDRLFYKYFQEPLPGQITSMHSRHEENKQIAENINKNVYKEALKFVTDPVPPTPFYQQCQQIFNFCLNHLNGVDVYWDGPVEAKPARETTEYEDEFGIRGKMFRVIRKTQMLENNGRKPGAKKLLNEKFGSLEIIPFPFSAIFKYDSGDDGIMFSWHQIAQGIERDPNEGLSQFKLLMEQNMDPQIIHLRELRLKLRTLNNRWVSAQHNGGMMLRGIFQLKTRDNLHHEPDEEVDQELDAYMGKGKPDKNSQKLKN